MAQTSTAAPTAVLTVSATVGRYSVTLTTGTGPAAGYWIETWHCDGEEFGDAMAVRLRGEDPTDYVQAAAATFAALRD